MERKVETNYSIEKMFGVFSFLSAVVVVLISKKFTITTLYNIMEFNTAIVIMIIAATYCSFFPKNRSNAYKYISYTLVHMGVIHFTLFYLFNESFQFGNVLQPFSIRLNTTILYIEVAFWLIGLLIVGKKVSNAVVIVGQSSMALLFFMGSRWIGDQVMFLLSGKETVFYLLAQLVPVLVFVYILRRLKEIPLLKKEILQKEVRLYIYLRIAIQLILVINGLVGMPSLLGINFLFRIFSNFCILKIFVADFISQRYERIYIDLQNEKDVLREMNRELTKTQYQLELALQRQKEILINIPEGVVGIHSDMIYFANDKMARLCGLNEGIELEGKCMEEFLRPDDFRKLKGIVKDSFVVDMSLMSFKYEDKLFMGEVRFIDLQQEGQETYILMVKDISDRLKLLELETIFLKKKEEDRIKNEVLANISHEFKTPVNVIYAATQLQQKFIVEQEWQSLERYNPMVMQNCNRLIRLINNFIDLTKFDYGEFHGTKSVINLVVVIEDITNSIVSFAETRGMQVLFDTEEEELYADVDLQLIDRIMLNILSNAIKYNKENGSIEVLMEADEKSVIVRIKDSGVGIPQEKMASLFTRFERVDKSLARENEGSGLGLNIVKNMIDYLDGYIHIDSVVGEGTTVTFYLPRVEAPLEECSGDMDAYSLDRLKKSVEMELADI